MIKLHLGCGRRDFGPDWVHIDGGSYPHLAGSDIVRLPYSNNSVDLIYASHVLEYFDREEVVYVLEKWFSKLVEGGVLRIAVPDFEAMVGLYYHNNLPLARLLGPLYGKMSMGDKTIYHKTVYDFNSLKTVLQVVGFQQIKRYNWQDTEHAHHDDHSQAYIPHMDKIHGTLISLNVEAVK